MMMEQPVKSLPSIRIYTLGPFLIECRRGDDTWERVEPGLWSKYPYARLLLQRLLCSSRRRVERSTLIEDLWPSATSDAVERYPTDAAYALRHKILGMPELVTLYGNQSGYQLAPQHQMWVDSDACLSLLIQAEQAGRTTATALPFLERAATLFASGGFLEGVAGQWTHSGRVVIERAVYRCHLWLAHAYEQQGMIMQAERLYNQLLEEYPEDESLLCSMVELFHRQGMKQQARHAYEEAKNRCEDLGGSLSTETHTFIAQLLRETMPPLTAIDHQGNREIRLARLRYGIIPSVPQVTSLPLTDEIHPFQRENSFVHLPSTTYMLLCRYLQQEQKRLGDALIPGSINLHVHDIVDNDALFILPLWKTLQGAASSSRLSEYVMSKLVSGQQVLLLGDAGQGKTILLKWLFRLFVQHFLTAPDTINFIPIYLPLREFSSFTGDPIEVLWSGVRERFPLAFEDFAFLMRNHQIVFLFDGFDEMKGDLAQQALSERAASKIFSYPSIHPLL